MRIKSIISAQPIKAFAVAAGLSLASVPAAFALPQFTLNPSGAGLVGGSVTADNILLSDFATVTYINGGPTFSDNGVLAVTGFQLNGGTVSYPGLDSTYGLYFKFTGMGDQTTNTFSQLDYTLFGYNRTSGQQITYNVDGSTPTGVTNPIALAQGSLINGGVGTTQGVPNAVATLNFNAATSAFFADPTPFYNVVFASFTNTSTQINQTGTGFTINSGGGAANFATATTAVPEPVSLVLLGGALAVTGVMTRRRNAR